MGPNTLFETGIEQLSGLPSSVSYVPIDLLQLLMPVSALFGASVKGSSDSSL